MKAVALDFDGVVSDSAREAFVVALRARHQLDPHPQLPAAEDATDPTLFEGPLFADFLASMPLGNRAEDYAVVLDAIATGAALPDQAAYDGFRATLDPAGLAIFHERFYRVRDRWRREDPAGWRRMLAPYPPLLAALRGAPEGVVLAIATAKDRASVELLLQDYGIADLFDPQHVLDKECGVRKRNHLGRLRDRLSVDFAEIRFVDDKLNHLEDVAALGVDCLLAGWGYNGAREHRAARHAGFRVADLADCATALFG